MSIYQLTIKNYPFVREIFWKSFDTACFRVALTGAGISMPSGLPSVKERVNGIELRRFFQPKLVKEDPAAYFSLYRDLLVTWRRAEPNAAHVALAENGFWIITQNIDGLHRDAGSERVIELHGNLRELRCTGCQTIFPSSLVWRSQVPVCPSCRIGLVPGVTLEGEEVRHYARAVDWMGRAQVVLVVGTALEMDPVRKLPGIAEKNGVPVIVINESAERLVPALFDSNAELTNGVQDRM